ncbi:hypothetical protein CFIO01_08198 [Colletotrichum fioriniae PJ7]|uniref:Uncharacterized protein n=1 Tax=Colletotrichum fioriniae PJ7 TaxID=1445577 RepID=A0A010QM11_9PEZI|nr:hypothetical protein CFIO01_08198 [Colletotrichum fioriniae PJ7]
MNKYSATEMSVSLFSAVGRRRRRRRRHGHRRRRPRGATETSGAGLTESAFWSLSLASHILRSVSNATAVSSWSVSPLRQRHGRFVGAGIEPRPDVAVRRGTRPKPIAKKTAEVQWTDGRGRGCGVGQIPGTLHVSYVLALGDSERTDWRREAVAKKKGEEGWPAGAGAGAALASPIVNAA